MRTHGRGERAGLRQQLRAARSSQAERPSLFRARAQFPTGPAVVIRDHKGHSLRLYRFSQLLHQGRDRGAGVSKQHERLVHQEQIVVDARKPGRHTAL